MNQIISLDLRLNKNLKIMCLFTKCPKVNVVIATENEKPVTTSFLIILPLGGVNLADITIVPAICAFNLNSYKAIKIT